jgi:hypothetical protein
VENYFHAFLLVEKYFIVLNPSLTPLHLTIASKAEGEGGKGKGG